MEKRYIFHYDETQRPWNRRVYDMMVAHDGMICFADIEDAGMCELVNTTFEDGTELNIFVYELEEVSEMGRDELVDKIASFFEQEENWSALKQCWLEDDRSNDLRRLLYMAIKE